jgi:hypothetical protein
MKKPHAIGILIGIVLAAVVACVLLWPPDNSSPNLSSHQSGDLSTSRNTSTGGEKPTRPVETEADHAPTGPAVNPSAPSAQDNAPGIAPRRKHIQSRAVPLAQLPPEIYQPALRPMPPAPRGSFSANRPPVQVAPPGPQLKDPLALARTRLAKDPRLTEWYDQWQIDHAVERPTPAARLTELLGLLEKTPLDSESLGAVAAVISAAEAPVRAVKDPWYAAAIDRAGRELKANPNDAAARRRFDELRAAAKAH